MKALTSPPPAKIRHCCGDQSSLIEWLVRIVLLAFLILTSYLLPFIREVQEKDWPLYNFPFTHDARISRQSLFLIEAGGYIILVILLTLCLFWENKTGPLKRSHYAGEGAVSRGFFSRYRWCSELVYQQTQLFWAFSLALLLTGITTNVTKNLVGRPRPDFLGRCKVMDFHREAPEFHLLGLIPRCTGDEREIYEGRRSFPSGHSSFSCCVAVFGALFIYFWLKPKLCRSIKNSSLPFVISVFFTFPALYCCLSRTMDYRHHWDDVLAGSILGSFFAILSYILYYGPYYLVPANLMVPHYGKLYWKLSEFDQNGFESNNKEFEGVVENTPLGLTEEDDDRSNAVLRTSLNNGASTSRSTPTKTTIGKARGANADAIDIPPDVFKKDEGIVMV